MQIDWFTIIAQALNFLVLLWLMKRFLYKPILRVIDEREKRISEQLASAESMKEKAEKQGEEYAEKTKEFDRERAALIDAAKTEAQEERTKLLGEAREAAESYSATIKTALENETLALHQEIVLRTRDEVLAIARKALSALAGTSLEERIVGLFTERLRGLEEEELQTIKSALKESKGPVIVRTSLALSGEQESSIVTSIQSLVGTDTKIQFDRAQDIISGIELVANGYKAAWSIGEYLSAIENGQMYAHDN